MTKRVAQQALAIVNYSGYPTDKKMAVMMNVMLIILLKQSVFSLPLFLLLSHFNACLKMSEIPAVSRYE